MGPAPLGVAGVGEGIPCPEGEKGGPLGGQSIKREHGQCFPCPLGPLGAC